MTRAGDRARDDFLDGADFRGEVIELRLHGVQALPVEVERLHDLVKHVLQTIEALVD